MNIPANLGKSTLLALCVFWTINFTKEFDLDFFPFVLLSAIPIGICVAVTILITICPLFWIFKKAKESNKSFTKRCFPYYITIVFGLCAFGVFALENEFYFTSFFITAFITTAQSWVWFAKEKNV